MLKPRLVKSLIQQNANLLRQRQFYMDYLRALEITLHAIELESKEKGSVNLKDLQLVRSQMRNILAANDISQFNQTGYMTPPTKEQLGAWVSIDQGIFNNFTDTKKVVLKDEKELKEFLNGFFNDIINHAKKNKEESLNDPEIDPMNFGGDLEGEWQGFPQPEDPFDDGEKK